jgi:hypothetical protein
MMAGNAFMQIRVKLEVGHLTQRMSKPRRPQLNADTSCAGIELNIPPQPLPFQLVGPGGACEGWRFNARMAGAVESNRRINGKRQGLRGCGRILRRHFQRPPRFDPRLHRVCVEISIEPTTECERAVMDRVSRADLDRSPRQP